MHDDKETNAGSFTASEREFSYPAIRINFGSLRPAGIANFLKEILKSRPGLRFIHLNPSLNCKN